MLMPSISEKNIYRFINETLPHIFQQLMEVIFLAWGYQCLQKKQAGSITVRTYFRKNIEIIFTYTAHQYFDHNKNLFGELNVPMCTIHTAYIYIC